MQEESLFMPNSIKTYTGAYFNYVDMKLDTIFIEDIAHALARIPRWLGHTKHTYSVAEHCVWCCNNMKDENLKLEALLHDATEAYIGDIPSPLKALLPGVKEIEEKLHQAIANRYLLKYPFPPEVKEVDLYALDWEWHHLKLSNRVEGWSAEKAKQSFLNTFHKYYKIRKDETIKRQNHISDNLRTQ